LLRSAVLEAGGDPAGIGQEALDRISRAWGSGELPAVELPGGVRVAPEGRHLRISGPRSPFLVDRELQVPGRWRLSGRNVHLTIVEESPPREPAAVSGPRVAWVDAERIVGRLRLRSRRPGDRYHPLGSGGTAKVQDLLVDRRIPRPWRDALPVIEDGAGILWIPGFRVDGRSRITEETTRAFRLEVTGTAPWLGSDE
jgi:tRNA(Ile)-lysidine synthase